MRHRPKRGPLMHLEVLAANKWAHRPIPIAGCYFFEVDRFGRCNREIYASKCLVYVQLSASTAELAALRGELGAKERELEALRRELDAARAALGQSRRVPDDVRAALALQ